MYATINGYAWLLRTCQADLHPDADRLLKDCGMAQQQTQLAVDIVVVLMLTLHEIKLSPSKAQERQQEGTSAIRACLTHHCRRNIGPQCKQEFRNKPSSQLLLEGLLQCCSIKQMPWDFRLDMVARCYRRPTAPDHISTWLASSYQGC